MAKRPAEWFRNLAIAGGAVAMLMVPAMELLQNATLSQWLHIPLTGVVLALMVGGAAAAGVGFLEYQTRSANRRQEAQQG